MESLLFMLLISVKSNNGHHELFQRTLHKHCKIKQLNNCFSVLFYNVDAG